MSGGYSVVPPSVNPFMKAISNFTHIFIRIFLITFYSKNDAAYSDSATPVSMMVISNIIIYVDNFEILKKITKWQDCFGNPHHLTIYPWSKKRTEYRSEYAFFWMKHRPVKQHWLDWRRMQNFGGNHTDNKSDIPYENSAFTERVFALSISFLS